MENVFVEIKAEIHEIRNLVGPFDLKLANLDQKISESRIFFEEKTAAIESKLMVTTVRVDENTSELSDLLGEVKQLSQRVRAIEVVLKLPPGQAQKKGIPVHEDKLNPAILPPQNPPP